MEKNLNKKNKQIALIGNPNTGKTTIFNALTGLRHSTANYPGVTVEKKTGWMKLPGGDEVSVLDLPGTYSLLPRSLDEEIVHDVLLGIRKETPPPDLVMVILDANNLERNLYLATQVLETGIPVIFVLNMWDMAQKNGVALDLGKLQELTGISCVATVGMEQEGIQKLAQTAETMLEGSRGKRTEFSVEPFLPELLKTELDKIVTLIESRLTDRPRAALGEALRLLSDRLFRSSFFKDPKIGDLLRTEVLSVRASLKQRGIDWTSVEPECRYAAIDALCEKTAQRIPQKRGLYPNVWTLF